MGGAELAREMWAAGTRTADIGREVGCTSDAVVGHAHRHGWPPHPKQPTGGLRRLTRADLEGAPQPVPKPRRPPKPAPEPKLRREACNPEPLAVPTARFAGCQWLDGDDRRTWRFCDAPVVPQGVYCADHYGLCYYRARALPEVAA
jgi:hypothetical protein